MIFRAPAIGKRANRKAFSAYPDLWPYAAFVPAFEPGGSDLVSLDGHWRMSITGSLSSVWRREGFRVHNDPFYATINQNLHLTSYPLTYVALVTPLEVGASGDDLWVATLSDIDVATKYFGLRLVSDGTGLVISGFSRNTAFEDNQGSTYAAIGQQNLLIWGTYGGGTGGSRSTLALNGEFLRPSHSQTFPPGVDSFAIGRFHTSSPQNSAVNGIIHYVAIYRRRFLLGEWKALFADPYCWLRERRSVAAPGVAAAAGLLRHPGMDGGMHDLTGGMRG